MILDFQDPLRPNLESIQTPGGSPIHQSLSQWIPVGSLGIPMGPLGIQWDPLEYQVGSSGIQWDSLGSQVGSLGVHWARNGTQGTPLGQTLGATDAQGNPRDVYVGRCLICHSLIHLCPLAYSETHVLSRLASSRFYSLIQNGRKYLFCHSLIRCRLLGL